jgi:hypothetical protein
MKLVNLEVPVHETRKVYKVQKKRDCPQSHKDVTIKWQ